MNYQGFTNETLIMMYYGARGALAVDDELTKLGERTSLASIAACHSGAVRSAVFYRGGLRRCQLRRRRCSGPSVRCSRRCLLLIALRTQVEHRGMSQMCQSR
jgi:hypothetical protein